MDKSRQIKENMLLIKHYLYLYCARSQNEVLARTSLLAFRDRDLKKRRCSYSTLSIFLSTITKRWRARVMLKPHFVTARSIITFLFLTTVNSHATSLLQKMDGQAIPFSSLKGKWVFINYWASWCQPCLDEIPTLNHFYQTTSHQKIALFAVNYDGLPAWKQQQLTQKAHIQYPALQQDPAVSLHLGDIIGVPATFVFDPQGHLVHTLYGAQSLEALNKIIT